MAPKRPQSERTLRLHPHPLRDGQLPVLSVVEGPMPVGCTGGILITGGGILCPQWLNMAYLTTPVKPAATICWGGRVHPVRSWVERSIPSGCAWLCIIYHIFNVVNTHENYHHYSH